jgi:hypothetical protein
MAVYAACPVQRTAKSSRLSRKSWTKSRSRLYIDLSVIGWTGSARSLRTMITITREITIGRLTFLRAAPGGQIVDLGGIASTLLLSVGPMGTRVISLPFPPCHVAVITDAVKRRLEVV